MTLHGADCLPAFLRETEPLELDQLPLQVALLTMELASIRMKLAALAAFPTGDLMDPTHE